MGVQSAAAGEAIGDVSCRVFNQIPGTLDPNVIHRFVVGEDAAPRALSVAEATEELADPLAVLLLLKGVFPRTGRELLSALDAATPDGDPLRERLFFLLGEGSQISMTPETQGLNRGLRFVVSTGPVSGTGPDLMISAFHPDDSHVEVMAWDERTGGFNYYRTVGENRAWAFAGNSRHAVEPATEGKGPFESHPSGNFLMKELRAPWLHWHSPDAPVPESVLAEDDPLRTDPWFTGLAPLGAVSCEADVARPSIQRWTERRFQNLLEGGKIERPARIISQVVGTPTANLMTSRTEGHLGTTVDLIGLPQTFFVDSQTLVGELGLEPPPSFEVASQLYVSSLATFDVHLTDRNGFLRPGDTHFAFNIPERSFEDHQTIVEAIRVGLLTKRLVGSLLMTDFPNPVFSSRRAQLLDHVPASATVAAGASTFSEEMATKILAAAATKGPGSPEAEFAAIWSEGEDGWREAANSQLRPYYAAVVAKLVTQDGFNAYCELAESRRNEVRELPIFENPLLFAETSIEAIERRMLPDGTVTSEVAP